MVKNDPSDVITLDLLMPEIPGLETLYRIHQLCPTTKMIVISSGVQPQMQKDLLEAGAHVFLVKSVYADMLLGTVDMVLSMKEQA